MLQSFLQIPVKAQPPEEDDFTSKKRAFMMMKHRCSALIKFHDAETPLLRIVDLHTAETPLFNTLDYLLFPNHHYQQTAPFPPLLKHQTHTFFPCCS